MNVDVSVGVVDAEFLGPIDVEGVVLDYEGFRVLIRAARAGVWAIRFDEWVAYRVCDEADSHVLAALLGVIDTRIGVVGGDSWLDDFRVRSARVWPELVHYAVGGSNQVVEVLAAVPPRFERLTVFSCSS